MNIVIIGSTQYVDLINAKAEELRAEGHTVAIPAFDSHPEFNELEICEHNRRLIELADEVRVVWDQRSFGTVFDFGMTFALRKPFKIEYLEPKTFANVMDQYERKFYI